MTEEYKTLLAQIYSTVKEGQNKVAYAVNTAMLETYWMIGQYNR